MIAKNGMAAACNAVLYHQNIKILAFVDIAPWG